MRIVSFNEFMTAKEDIQCASAILLTDKDYDQQFRDGLCGKVIQGGAKYFYFAGKFNKLWKHCAEEVELTRDLKACKSLGLTIPKYREHITFAALNTLQAIVEEIEYQADNTENSLVLYDDADLWEAIKKYVRFTE